MSEFDLLVVGAGAGGLVTALRAHELGLSVCVLEALEKAGGATAFSGGQVWAGANHVMARQGLADSLEETCEYVFAIADERGLIDEELSRRWIAAAPEAIRWLEEIGAVRWEIIPGYPDYYFPQTEAAKAEGRYLTAAPFEGRRLGDWRGRMLTSPHFPVGVTYAELFELGASKARLKALLEERRQKDVLTFGTALAAHLLLATSRRGIPIMLEHRVTELLSDAGRVTGVRCETPDSMKTFEGSVVLATSTYDWDEELVRTYSRLEPETTGSVAPPSLRGDAIRLARDTGAEIIGLPPDALPHVPGYRSPMLGPHDAGYRNCAELALPHCFIVNRAGQRFCEDSFYRPIARAALGHPEENLPFFLIWDAQHHRKYGLGLTPPGEPYPEELGVRSAPTLPELGTRLGIDGDRLAATAARFSAHAREGADPDFGRGQNPSVLRFRGDPNHRPNPALGAVEQAPFFGMRMRLMGTAIGAAGVRAGHSGEALDAGGQPIPGLYAVGCAAALTTSGTGYNSGFSLSRAVTFGYLAAAHAAEAVRPPSAARRSG